MLSYQRKVQHKEAKRDLSNLLSHGAHFQDWATSVTVQAGAVNCNCLNWAPCSYLVLQAPVWTLSWLTQHQIRSDMQCMQLTAIIQFPHPSPVHCVFKCLRTPTFCQESRHFILLVIAACCRRFTRRAGFPPYFSLCSLVQKFSL